MGTGSIEELQRTKRLSFDPEVVDAFLRVSEQRESKLVCYSATAAFEPVLIDMILLVLLNPRSGDLAVDGWAYYPFGRSAFAAQLPHPPGIGHSGYDLFGLVASPGRGFAAFGRTLYPVTGADCCILRVQLACARRSGVGVGADVECGRDPGQWWPHACLVTGATNRWYCGFTRSVRGDAHYQFFAYDETTPLWFLVTYSLYPGRRR